MNPNSSEEFRKFATKHMGISSLTLDKYTSAVPNVPLGMTPNIIEERQMNIAVMDVFSRLMMDRIIFLGTGFKANLSSESLTFSSSSSSVGLRSLTREPPACGNGTRKTHAP